MRYLGLTTLLTITILSISIYSLSFTIFTRRVENKANKHALNAYGGIDFEKRQAFLKDQINKPLYTLPLLGATTYQEAKEKSLKLGLDLTGGTRLSFIINITALLKKLAGRNQRKASFIKALQKTKQEAPESTNAFIKIFVTHYTTLSNKPIQRLFLDNSIQTQLNSKSSLQDLIKAIEQAHKNAVKNNVRAYQNRLGSSSSVNITVDERQQIITLEAPGSDRTDQKRLKKIIETPGQIAIYKVKDLSEKEQNNFVKQLEKQLKTQKVAPKKSLKKLLITSSQGSMLCKAKDVVHVNKYLQSEIATLLLPYGISPVIASKPYEAKDNDAYYPIYFADVAHPILEGTQIKNAEMGFHQGSYVVHLTTNSIGAKALRKYTSNNIGSRIMIAFDNRAYTVPMVQSEIPNGQCQISGNNMSEQEAIDIANICTSGAVTPTETIEETIIGPTLSEKAQSQGMIAVILALILILLFMIMYYGVAGILSSIGLIINAIIILGSLAQIKAALTLPGIAGLIISLGTGIDGSVIINEAIIDQLRKGKNLYNAIINGYKKSYSSILDANITTLLASIILYMWGQGAIKGFAITLTIGTISSCFSSVLITRVIKELFVRTIGVKRLSFSIFKRTH